ncbi:BamA/TamA family outer membrane protein [Reichenbachiella ulvae]|uniref:Bacterial surface antigen (D15) domain-containing protein n=1 Tax=Reichenbachiella ulvae TaxID=2980104 RepID=A0ABT3CRN1_9BACT|nr:BamA/TamA family outer membrane protein [Reichenbachiella ulvae]MCV9386294.1 hypothetical protein [Reichenbachiella ulvae]
MARIIPICILLCLILYSSSLVAQEVDTTLPTAEAGKLYFIPLPAIGYNPVTGLLYGVAASGNILLGDPSDTRLSSAFLTTTYTTNSQLLMTLKSTVYSKHDKWISMGDWRLLLSSQPTYGLGTGKQSELLLSNEENNFELGKYNDGVDKGELMEFNLFRFHETVLRQVHEDFYAGVGFHYDGYWKINDVLLNLDSDPPYVTNHYAYSTIHGFRTNGYTTSGPSINAVYDSRDNINSPYKGRYAFLQFKMLPTWLGSDRSATQLWLEYRDYFSMSRRVERNILAIWSYFNLTTSGRLPYMGLPALGWDQFGKSGRAYPQGRYRGEHLFYFEAEYRFRIPIQPKHPERFGGVVFVNTISASADDLKLNLFDHFKSGAGVGFRFMLKEATRSNVTLDYGYGMDKKGAFYFNINEYF